MKCVIVDCDNEVAEGKCPECLETDRKLADVREKTAELIIEEGDLDE